MKEAAAALNRRRTLVLAANLGYFLALAALGFFLFFRSRSAAVYVTALAALAVYLLLIRPMTERYKAALRGEILRNGVCGGFTDVTYAPREGFKAADFLESGLVNTLSEKAFLSREKVTGRRGELRMEMADVTFPVRENGLNNICSGLYIRMSRPGAAFPAVTVRAGQTDETPLEGRALALLKEMASFVPGSLYLNTEGDTLHIFFRGRFIAFRINPMMQITESTLRVDPLPETDQALRLALMLARKGTDNS